MEFFILLLIGLLIFLVLAPILAFARASHAARLVEELRGQLTALENEVRLLRRKVDPVEGAAPESWRAAHAPEPTPAVQPVPPPIEHKAPIAPVRPPQPPATPPPLHPVAPPVAAKTPEPPEPKVPEPSAAKSADVHTPFDWEQFMGARLFAWIGGLALFLGIAFFVKYSFEHILIPPEMRVAIGFVAGAALVLGGLLIRRKENAVTSQTLCATGVLVLYAVTYACRSYYHFPFFGSGRTFVLMAVITALAFLLSVKMDALVVAVLGVAGGFLTPPLLWTGQDNPLALFIYIAVLDAGLLSIAQRQRWKSLRALGVLGTVITQVQWYGRFFEANHYANGNNVLIPMAVFAGFQALFLAAAWFAKRTDEKDESCAYAALAMGGIAMAASFDFLSFPQLAHRLPLLCGYLFLTDLGLLALTLIARRLSAVRTVAGMVAFAFLSIWTATYLTNDSLNVALGCYLLFAAFHTALPLILQRLENKTPSAWTHIFPVISLALVMEPIMRFHDLSILLWPFVLLVDVLAFIVALATMSLAPVILVLLLTLAALGGTLLQISTDLTGLSTDLVLLGACSIFFLFAGAWAARRLASRDAGEARLFGALNDPANLRVQLPALSAILPFLLLIMVILRLPLHDPTPVFALALLLVLLLLGLARVLSLDGLALVGLGSVLALEHAWLNSPYFLAAHLVSLRWNLAFYVIFTVFPFLFRRHFEKAKSVWIASALASPLHFYLVYDIARFAFPGIPHGVFPALFALPSLAALAAVAKLHRPPNPARDTQLALFGGVALFFITLIFPLQFTREWITISWALEGAALCWLFHRVPHPGLRITGCLLLLTSFARLGFNIEVLDYHARAPYPIFNWYLYAYGVVSVALFVAAWLLAGPRNLIAGINVQPPLNAMATYLLFLLLNIEIADYFTAPGASVLTFEFSSNFARDMSYSIAWALFALLLLVIGMCKRNAAIRYASLGLLGITVLKLFLHDLSQLDQLYRIGAFIAVAIIAILSSFLYQRFLAFPQPQAEAPR